MMNIDALMKANNGNISAVTENIIKTEDPWYIVEYLRDMSESISINDVKKILHALENIYKNNKDARYFRYFLRESGHYNRDTSLIEAIFMIFKNQNYYNLADEIIDEVIDAAVKSNNPNFIADCVHLLWPQRWCWGHDLLYPLSQQSLEENAEKIMGALEKLNSPDSIIDFCNAFCDWCFKPCPNIRNLRRHYVYIEPTSIDTNHFSNFTRIMIERGTPEEIVFYMRILSEALRCLNIWDDQPTTRKDFISSIDIEGLANVVANSDDPNSVYIFSKCAASFYDQKSISEGMANKFAKIILKSQRLGNICNFIPLYGIGNQLSSDVLSKLIDKIIELSSIEGKIEKDCIPFIYIASCYRIIDVGKIRKEDLCRINDHILKIGNLNQIIEHAYFHLHLMQDKDKKNITEKIINSKNAKAIYTYITCWDKTGWNKKGDLELSCCENDRDYCKWNQNPRPSPLKEEEVLNLIKVLINEENISIDSQDYDNLQIVRGLIEKSNNYAEFSAELNKFTVTSKGKLKVEKEPEKNKQIDSKDDDNIVKEENKQIDMVYVDDSINEKNNNHSKNKILEFIKKIKKHN